MPTPFQRKLSMIALVAITATLFAVVTSHVDELYGHLAAGGVIGAALITARVFVLYLRHGRRYWSDESAGRTIGLHAIAAALAIILCLSLANSPWSEALAGMVLAIILCASMVGAARGRAAAMPAGLAGMAAWATAVAVLIAAAAWSVDFHGRQQHARHDAGHVAHRKHATGPMTVSLAAPAEGRRTSSNVLVCAVARVGGEVVDNPTSLDYRYRIDGASVAQPEAALGGNIALIDGWYVTRSPVIRLTQLAKGPHRVEVQVHEPTARDAQRDSLPPAQASDSHAFIAASAERATSCAGPTSRPATPAEGRWWTKVAGDYVKQGDYETADDVIRGIGDPGQESSAWSKIGSQARKDGRLDDAAVADQRAQRAAARARKNGSVNGNAGKDAGDGSGKGSGKDSGKGSGSGRTSGTGTGSGSGSGNSQDGSLSGASGNTSSRGGSRTPATPAEKAKEYDRQQRQRADFIARQSSLEGKLKKIASRHGIAYDPASNAFRFGSSVVFPARSDRLTPAQQRVVQSMVPDLLRIAKADDKGANLIDRIVIEGFASPEGRYLSNLDLSARRSQRAMCAILLGAPTRRQQDVVKLFATGGASSRNFLPDPDKSDNYDPSRRVEMRVVFFDRGEPRTASIDPRILLRDGLGQCPLS